MVSQKKLLSELSGFHSTEQYHKVYPNLMLTDGVHWLFHETCSYWIADMVYSYQSLPIVAKELFQVYDFKVNLEKSTAVMICTDGNENILKKKYIEYTDFPLESIRLYYQNNVLLLPSEY